MAALPIDHKEVAPSTQEGSRLYFAGEPIGGARQGCAACRAGRGDYAPSILPLRWSGFGLRHSPLPV